MSDGGREGMREGENEGGREKEMSFAIQPQLNEYSFTPFRPSPLH